MKKSVIIIGIVLLAAVIFGVGFLLGRGRTAPASGQVAAEDMSAVLEDDAVKKESADGGGDEKTVAEEAVDETAENKPAEDTPAASETSGEKDAGQENAGIAVSLSAVNRWEEGGKQMQQIDGRITNDSSAPVDGWEVQLALPKGASVQQGWNADYRIEGNVLYAKPVDYNREIGLGSAVEFGLILATDESFDPEDYSLLAGGEKIAGGGKPASGGETADKADEGDKTDNAGASIGKAEAGQQEKQGLSERDDKSGKEAGQTEEDKKKDTASDKKGSQSAGSALPVQTHGKLSVKGTEIVDKDGKPFSLRGVSTHGIAWFPEYVNKEAFQSLRDGFGVNLIRLALYSDPNAGYSASLHQKVKEGVSIATELSMYVIIDWHILGDNDPCIHEKEATAFFEEMTEAYKEYDNVLYEICNEPNSGTSWDGAVKPYAERMIKTIRKKDKDAIIIVGTPTWCQDLDVAAQNPITGEENIMYACHFYAATHKADIRNKAKKALDKGLPVFVSEFSICDASGNGALDKASADEWFAFIRENNLSCAAWSLCNKNESSALLKPDCRKKGGFSEGDLSESGSYILKQYLSE